MPRSLPCGCARARRRRPLLHIFTFAYPEKDGFRRQEVVLLQSRDDQVALLPQAYADARLRGSQPYATDIRSVPPPRPTPRLDRLCRQCTAFPDFLALLIAPGGYYPSIRLDLVGKAGRTLARAYDKQMAAWGDTRRTLLWTATPTGDRR